MRVQIRARHAHLEARVRGIARDDADRGAPVLQAVRDARRRPEVGHEALVAVDGGREEGHDGRQRGEQAGEEVAAQV